jgi:hypothetical protein
MKLFTIIVCVLFFALAGRSQVQKNLHQQNSCSSVLAVNENSFRPNTVISQDNFFDEQDSNDFDEFDCVIISPDSNFNSPQFEIKDIVIIIPRLHLIHVGELLLDLPPPLLSV